MLTYKTSKNYHNFHLPRNQKREIGLAMMLFCVVTVFFLCNVLALVGNVLEQFVGIEKFEWFDQIIQGCNSTDT